MNNANLINHVDTRKIARFELGAIPTPPPTETHQPVPHIQIVEAIAETLELRKLRVARDEYAVSSDGMRMFGIMEIEEIRQQPSFFARTEEKMFRFAIGLRNSNDKSMSLGLTAGYRVIVCDNMAFAGDFEPVFHKHTKRLDLSQVISLAVDKIQRNFAPLEKQIEEWREFPLSDDEAKVIIYDAFRSSSLKLPLRLLHRAHRHYFEPLDKEFTARTYWSLVNALTFMVKELPPVKQFQVTAKLGGFLNNQFNQFFQVADSETAKVLKFPASSASANKDHSTGSDGSEEVFSPPVTQNSSNFEVKAGPATDVIEKFDENIYQEMGRELTAEFEKRTKY